MRAPTHVRSDGRDGGFACQIDAPRRKFPKYDHFCAVPHPHISLAPEIIGRHHGLVPRARSLPHYAGARGRIDIANVRSLSSRYRLQPKVDGAYCHVLTDELGRIAQVVSRTGRPYRCDDLVGIVAGAPRSVLVGELEAHTEAGTRAAEWRGYRLVHLFDAVQLEGRSITEMPYEHRMDALWDWRLRLASDPSTLSYSTTEHGHRDPVTGQFVSDPVPRDWRRLPIVDTLPLTEADTLWDQSRADALEGFVAVAMDAPLGRRRSKLKCKPVDHLDCIVLEADAKTARVRSFGRDFLVPCHGLDLSGGDVVEVAYNGTYGDGTPRFARIVRERRDLQSRDHHRGQQRPHSPHRLGR